MCYYISSSNLRGRPSVAGRAEVFKASQTVCRQCRFKNAIISGILTTQIVCRSANVWPRGEREDPLLVDIMFVFVAPHVDDRSCIWPHDNSTIYIIRDIVRLHFLPAPLLVFLHM